MKNAGIPKGYKPLIYLRFFGCPGYGRCLKIVILIYYGFIDTDLSGAAVFVYFHLSSLVPQGRYDP